MNYILSLLLLMTFCVPALFGQSGFRNPLPETVKGDRLFAEEKYKEALREYSSLASSPEVLKRLGATHIKLWDMSSAITILRDAVRKDSRDTEAKAFLAEALSWNRNFGEAVALYKQVLATGDAPSDTRVGYARTLSWMKDVVGAEREYRLATRENPDNLDAYMGLAEVLSWNKKFDQAIETYRRVVALTSVPEYKAVALAHIGRMYIWKGDMDPATEAYNDALRHDAKNVDAMFGLGELHEWSGKYPAAKSYYQKILQVQSDHKGAKAKLLQLMWVK